MKTRQSISRFANAIVTPCLLVALTLSGFSVRAEKPVIKEGSQGIAKISKVATTTSAAKSQGYARMQTKPIGAPVNNSVQPKTNGGVVRISSSAAVPAIPKSNPRPPRGAARITSMSASKLAVTQDFQDHKTSKPAGVSRINSAKPATTTADSPTKTKQSKTKQQAAGVTRMSSLKLAVAQEPADRNTSKKAIKKKSAGVTRIRSSQLLVPAKEKTDEPTADSDSASPKPSAAEEQLESEKKRAEKKPVVPLPPDSTHPLAVKHSNLQKPGLLLSPPSPNPNSASTKTLVPQQTEPESTSRGIVKSKGVVRIQKKRQAPAARAGRFVLSNLFPDGDDSSDVTDGGLEEFGLTPAWAGSDANRRLATRRVDWQINSPDQVDGDQQERLEIELAEALSPIGMVSTDIRLPADGKRPQNVAKGLFDKAGMTQQVAFGSYQGFVGAPRVSDLPAYDFYQRPLYFEDANLERCGVEYSMLQPFVSAAYFYGTIPLLPYKMVVQPPKECVWSLGDCPPCHRYSLTDNYFAPLQANASLVEAGFIVGLIFLIP